MVGIRTHSGTNAVGLVGTVLNRVVALRDAVVVFCASNHCECRLKSIDGDVKDRCWSDVRVDLFPTSGGIANSNLWRELRRVEDSKKVNRDDFFAAY
jgi:hypothetical protein